MDNIVQITAPSFAILVKRLRILKGSADAFEVDLDAMRVKGDLAVIYKHFGVPLIARSQNLELLRSAAKAGWPYVRIPEGMELDDAFRTLVKNKEVTILSGESA